MLQTMQILFASLFFCRQENLIIVKYILYCILYIKKTSEMTERFCRNFFKKQTRQWKSWFLFHVQIKQFQKGNRQYKINFKCLELKKK